MRRISSNSLEIVRNDNVAGFESSGVEGDGIIYGYAAGYDGPLNSLPFGTPGAGGRALPGAFKNIDFVDHTVVWNINQAEPIGKVLSLYEDPEKGLYYKAKLILKVQKAREIYAMLRFGVSMNSSVYYMEAKSIIDQERSVEEGIKVYSTLWIMGVSISAVPLMYADPVTALYYNE
ncbi:hypothetical protein RLOatenuis_3840 [Rickettsiales bacterium]|nr:hypothetical protein RLOatenuis_3840 [Rickettsiales bacterium]